MFRRSVLALMLWTPVLAAQALAPPPRGAPAPAAASAPLPLGSILAPPPPQVSDPMLEPPAPAPHVVSSWREALTIVKSRSVDLRIALGDVERAEAQSRQALASLLPTLQGTANVTTQLIRTGTNQTTGDTQLQFLPDRSTSYGAGLSLSVPLLAPRAWYAQDTAKQNQRIASMSLQEQRRLLAASMANALAAVVTNERVVELNRIGLRGALERLVLTKRRADLGVANALDVLRLEQDAASARATIISGDETLRQAREALGLALGVPEPYGAPRDMSLDAIAQESERVCGKVNAVEDRTDIVVARERIVIARRSHRDVELQFYPTIDLRSAYNLTRQPFFNPGGTIRNPQSGAVLGTLPTVDRTITLHSWSLAGVLSWTIFDGGIRYAQLRDTRAQVDQAEARLEQTRRNATIEVSRAVRGVEVAEQARKVAESARDLARETERLARVGFELGRGTSLELVDAARQLRQAEVQLALREFDSMQAKIRAQIAQANCDY